MKSDKGVSAADHSFRLGVSVALVGLLVECLHTAMESPSRPTIVCWAVLGVSSIALICGVTLDLLPRFRGGVKKSLRRRKYVGLRRQLRTAKH